MDKLVLLIVISMAYLCDAGLVLFNNIGIAKSSSEELEGDAGNEQSCGRIIAPIGGEFRIEKPITSSGTDSKYIEFSWMVALFALRRKYQQCALTDSKCWFSRCGGSLIGPKVMLLTAKCVYPYKPIKLKVRAGDWNLDTFEERDPYQEQFVNKIIIHPQYRDFTAYRRNELRYDAALLFMESPFIIMDNIAFICLPPPNLNVTSRSCKLAGWGVQTSMAAGSSSLLTMDLNYMDHDQCQRTLRQNWHSKSVLHDSFTCAGGALGKGACQVGSPLMCVAEDHYYALGLLSWDVGCGLANTPIVYTDVVKVRSWIDQEMTANGFTTDTYTPTANRK